MCLCLKAALPMNNTCYSNIIVIVLTLAKLLVIFKLKLQCVSMIKKKQTPIKNILSEIPLIDKSLKIESN